MTPDVTLHPSNRLREYRERNDLTQQQVADELARLAWEQRHRRVGINGDMVSKWERGEKGLSKLYRNLFCLLYRATQEQLGLTRAGGIHRPQPSATTLTTSGICSVSSVSVMDALGLAGIVLQPKLLELQQEEAMERRSILKMLGLGALAVSLEGASAPTTLRSEAIALSPSTIEALDELTVSYQRLYHSAAPADLLTPVRAHLQTTTELLRTSPARELRMRLLRNRSQVATLAGRLSFFDLQDALGARSYYNIALEAAREAGDDRLASNSLGHISFVPASEGSFAAAGDYLHGAR